jgi:hypothetical protein
MDDGHHILGKKMATTDFLEPQRFFRRFLLLLLSIVFLGCLPAKAAESSDRKQVESKAVALMDSHDCAGAWEILWPLAKTGNPQALTLLTQLVVFHDLVPPVSISRSQTATLEEQRLDHLLALGMAGWKNLKSEDEVTATGLVTAMAEERDGDDLKRLARCMKNNEDKDQCVKLAVDLKLIPSFEEYVKTMDRATASAICLPDNRPKK